MTETPRTASAERFSEQVSAIAGVDLFVLVRNDGRIVTHNMPDPEAFARLLTTCGQSAITLRKPLGVSHLKRIVFERPDNRSIIIFQLFKYFLGIQQERDTDQETVIHEVSHLLRQVAQSRAH